MSSHITIRFYAELNDFLPPASHHRPFKVIIKQAGSIKDLVESLGVPHTEIDLILVNGHSVAFNYRVKNGDRISVYPVFEALDITPVIRLRPQPLRDTRFIADTHLGRLTAYLRMLGFDTVYQVDYDDATLADLSAKERRILLTCDVRLLMRKQVTHGYYVRERLPRRQLVEVVSRFDLWTGQHPFTRCMHCNGEIRQVRKEAVEQHIMPRTRTHYEEFWQCQDCRKIYWKGSHYRRMLQLISETKNAPANA